MNTGNKNLYRWGAISGIAGTVCYIAAIAIPFHPTARYLIAMAWPVLSIIFAYSIYRYIANERPTASNQLSFVFACLGFTLVASMLSVQMATGLATDDFIAASPDKKEQLQLIHRTIRYVDMGIDVAWDIFIGTSLIFLSFAIKRHPHFRLWWSVLAALLGTMLIVLNVITFPYPPDSKGLFDIGPGIGLYIILLSSRLLWLAIRMK
jgi:hypothetical protein